MRTPQKLHEALMIFTAEAYLTRSIEDGLTDDPFHRKLVSGINSYRTMRRFSKEELELVVDLGKEEYMEKLKQIEIAFVIYALQILKRAAEDYTFIIGVGRKKLLKGKAEFAIDMLKLKQRDKEKYQSTKAIIDESVIVANRFYDYTQNHIKEKLNDQ